MATSTTKTTSTKKTATTAAVDNTSATIAENAELKAKLAEQEKQMQEIMAQMKMMGEMMATANASARPVEKKDDRPIRFVNLFPGTLVMKGSTIWKIEGQFNYRDFMETEASIIVSNMGEMIRAGSCWIADAEFVEAHNLTEIYKYLLSDETLKSLFDKDAKYVIESYKMANDNQKEIILDMIGEKINKGEEVDANILMTIGKLSGRDLISEANSDDGEPVA